MLVRIYADDAHQIALEYQLDKVITNKAHWNFPELRWELEEGICICKVRVGGTFKHPIHHYFLLAKAVEKDKAEKLLELVAEHCHKSRCYYIMPTWVPAIPI